jgi:hypothetical protein
MRDGRGRRCAQHSAGIGRYEATASATLTLPLMKLKEQVYTYNEERKRKYRESSLFCAAETIAKVKCAAAMRNG